MHRYRSKLWGRRATFVTAALLIAACTPAPNATPESPCGPRLDGYDYIVVGSGAGGGPLAARLAEAGCHVLLLEAGQDVGGKIHYQVPAMHALSTENPEMAWSFFVDHHRDAAIDGADSKLTPDGILYPRGFALGGSTAINALVTVLPSSNDWNRLAARTQASGFRAENMRPYYERVRQWLDVEHPDPAPASEDERILGFLASALGVHTEDTKATPVAGALATPAELSRALSQDMNGAFLDGEAQGVFRMPLATRDGRRHGTRERLLDVVQAGHPLTIRTGSFVTKVLWDLNGERPKAVGVEYVSGGSPYRAVPNPESADRSDSVFAARDVILSAGAFNSPQLLLLSGVGNEAELGAMGIPTVAHVPGVGRNLQDRVEIAVVSEFADPIKTVERCTLGQDDMVDPCLADWNNGQGVYETTGFLASVLRRSSPASLLSDLQVFASPGDARGYYPGYAKAALQQPNHFSWLVLKGHTNNNDGSVRLASADPFVRPIVEFNYFDEDAPYEDPDLMATVAGIKFVRRIIRRMQDHYDDDPPQEIWPGPTVRTDRELADFVRRETWGHHASCSNKMGPADDPLAVVDSRFRVHGVDGLRVVDASVWPEIPGTFIALPTFMLSERAADIILEDLDD